MVNKKVLVIEDDEISSAIIKKILTSNNCISKFEIFKNGLEAYEKIMKIITVNESLPDFIILDINMPIMNGLEFLKKIKYIEKINQIPIFINSASFELNEDHNFLDYENVKVCFSKPFTAQALNTILEYIESV